MSESANLHYEVDTESGLLRQTWRGAVTARDVVDFWQRLIADQRTLACGLHLNDLRDCSFGFSGNEWLDLIVEVLERMPPHAPWRAAIVVNRDDTLGVVRQFLGYAGTLVHGQVFDDLEQATAWLTGP